MFDEIRHIFLYYFTKIRPRSSTRDNFGKLIHQFQPETKTLIRKLKGSKQNNIDKMCLYYLIKHT